MNLVVDVGNTLVKMAVFENHEILFDQAVDAQYFLEKVKVLFAKYPNISQAIVSSVGQIGQKEAKILSLFCTVHELTHQSKLPFKNSYATPQSLGVDRIALAAAAFYKYPKSNVLIIDAGTCITYDIVNDYGEYLGGAISPGIQMRYNAMHQQTAKLPLLTPSETLDYIGNSTENCMHSGVLNGTAREVDGVIDQYNERFEHLTVILTGGDAQIFGKRVKNSIFAHSKILLEGLNYLLEYNKR
ncbi:type III pantothenate kinase [Croceivirga thetidis]|uniref:Type III pantothenate kinase n=1 Tax=Croceivirga thetidis TaxID=2721623 RepID=A0ABX1GPX3_9FLAO|nr:type III pantothenate kinase [Croceivirga thetidis]NKI31679.1 type III pantothenate kinase [Croceivirga thetidis]